jgi:hypothetical protein
VTSRSRPRPSDRRSVVERRDFLRLPGADVQRMEIIRRAGTPRLVFHKSTISANGIRLESLSKTRVFGRSRRFRSGRFGAEEKREILSRHFQRLPCT